MIHDFVTIYVLAAIYLLIPVAVSVAAVAAALKVAQCLENRRDR